MGVPVVPDEDGREDGGKRQRRHEGPRAHAQSVPRPNASRTNPPKAALTRADP